MNSREGFRLVLNKFGSSKASAQLKVLLAIVVFSIASALLLNAIYAENPQGIPEQGKYAEDKQIIENVLETPKEDITFKTMAVACGDNISVSTTLSSGLSCAGDGLIINTSNVVLDCNGSTIARSGSSNTNNGIIAIGLTNITIKNCKFDYFENSTWFNNVNDSFMINNTVTNGWFGLVFTNSHSNQITNNTVSSSARGGIALTSCYNNIVLNNTISSATTATWYAGIYVLYGGNNSLKNNSISSNHIGVVLNGVIDNILYGNNISSNGAGTPNYGVRVYSSNRTQIYSNYLTNNGAYGLYIEANSVNTTVYHNNIYNNPTYNIYSDAALDVSNGNEGNYWGRTSCPVFNATNDSNDANVNDIHAYSAENGWLTTGPAVCNCDTTISSSTTLITDLTNCSGNALWISTTGVALDCAGHSITGTANGSGVSLYGSASNISIKNCVISNFTKDIDLGNGGNNNITIYNNTLSHSDGDATTHALVYTSQTSNSTIDSNRMDSSNGSAIHSGGYLTGSNITNNNITNTGYGVYLYAQASNNLIKGNFINNTTVYSYSTAISIGDDSSFNAITNNDIEYSNYGIYVRGWVTNLTGNNITGNTIVVGIRGININDVGAPGSYVVNTLIKDNWVDTTTRDLELSNFTNVLVYHNNFVGATPHVTSDRAVELSNGTEGNYWERASCPVFIPGTDSNRTDANDSHAYDAQDGWLTIQPATCIACGDAITTSTTLPTDLIGCTANGLNITASNVVLNCAGHTISGSSPTGYGIYINYGLSNITIKNCTIAGFNASNKAGIFSYINGTSGSSNVTIMDSIFYSNYIGIGCNVSKVSGIYNWTILNNNFLNSSGSSGYGIWMIGHGTTIKGNTIKNQLMYGIRLNYGGGNVIRDNAINHTIFYDGMYIEGGVSGADVIQNNSVTYSGQYGINLASSDTITTTIIDNNMTNNNMEGLSLADVANKTVYHNNIHDNNANGTQVIASNAIELSNSGEGNYWGHNSCPVFTPGTDSNLVTVTDTFPYASENGWTSGDPARCCGDIIASSTTLTANLTGCTANGLNIAADNVVLDCAGHKIGGDYSGNGDGINTTAVSNLVIKNCTIYGFNGTNRAGINIGGGNNTKIINNVLYNNHYGIVRNDQPYYYNYNISNNLIQNTTFNSGIFIANISGLNAYNNRIYNTGSGYGIYTVFTNGTISGNIINNTYTAALSMSYFSGTITNNTLTYANYIWGGVGLELHSDYPVNITNNTITNNVYYGLYFDTSYDNSNKLVYHNNVYNNSPYQVYSLDTMELSYNHSGNYWGHDSCPVFTSGVDSGTTYSITDSYAYNVSNGWLTTTLPQCFVITSFVDNASQTYSNIGIYGSMAAPYPIALYINVSNSTGAAGVNLSHGGICIGLSNPQPLPYGNGVFNITCYVNKTKLQDLSSEYNITAIAYQLSAPATKSEANYTLYSDFVLPTILDLGVTNPDIFFSPYDSIVNVYANVTENGVPTVTANFSNITGGAACTNVAMPFNATSGFYEGSCDIGSYITVTNFTSKQIIVAAIDDFDNFDIDGTGIAVHNYGVPAFNKGPCLMLGSGSTNLSTELDFAHVNFTFDIKVNVSCYMNSPTLPGNWRDGANIEIYDVDLSNQSTAQRLSNLSSNIDVIITGPNSFGDSRIYINSNYFRELNKSATIKFFGLPFSEMPNIIADSSAAGFNASSVTWDDNGYQSDLGVVTGNLTFDVYGFSGYNATENFAPVITINSPTNGSTIAGDTLVDVTVDGTGTQLSNITVKIGSTTIFSYNNNQTHTNCTNLTVGWDVVQCTKNVTGMTNGAKTLVVTTKDFGGKNGNSANKSITFTVDTNFSVTIINPANNSRINSSDVTFNATTNFAAGTCMISIDGDANSTMDNSSSTSWGNVTTGLSDAIHNAKIWCNRSIDGLGNTATVYFTVDTTAPTITITSPQNITYGTTIVYNVTTNEAAAWCKYDRDGVGNDSMSGSSTVWTKTQTVIGGGPHDVDFYCSDLAGNVGTNNTPFTVDDTAPAITVNSPGNATSSSTRITLLNVTTDETAVWCNYSLNGASNRMMGNTSSTDWNSTVTAIEGLNYVVFYCRDIYANTGASSTTYFTVDTTAPTFTNVTVVNITSSSAIIITITNENSSCTLYHGTDSSNLSSDGPMNLFVWIGGLRHNLTLTSLADGTLYYYKVSCRDRLANIANSSIYNFMTAAVETAPIPNNTATNVTINTTVNGVNQTVAQFEIYSNESVNVTITLTPTGSNPTNATLGVPGLGTYYTIEASGLNSSNIKWVVIKVYYNDSDIPSGVDESALSLYWFNPATSSWEAITPGGVDTVNNYVWANTTHFSVYTIGGETTTTGEQQGGGGLGGAAPAGNATAWTGTTLDKSMIVGDSVTFKLDGTEHTIKLTSLGATYAFLQISSNPVPITINVGETKLIDVDRDGTNDISIKLDRVEAGKAYFTFTKLAAVPPITGVTTAQPTEQPAAAEQPQVTEQPSVTAAPDNTAMTILFTALLVIAVIAAIVVFTKKTGK
jgi:parallel beta-helix repeat protein